MFLCICIFLHISLLFLTTKLQKYGLPRTQLCLNDAECAPAALRCDFKVPPPPIYRAPAGHFWKFTVRQLHVSTAPQVQISPVSELNLSPHPSATVCRCPLNGFIISCLTCGSQKLELRLYFNTTQASHGLMSSYKR